MSYWKYQSILFLKTPLNPSVPSGLEAVFWKELPVVYTEIKIQNCTHETYTISQYHLNKKSNYCLKTLIWKTHYNLILSWQDLTWSLKLAQRVTRDLTNIVPEKPGGLGARLQSQAWMWGCVRFAAYFGVFPLSLKEEVLAGGGRGSASSAWLPSCLGPAVWPAFHPAGTHLTSSSWTRSPLCTAASARTQV